MILLYVVLAVVVVTLWAGMLSFFFGERVSRLFAGKRPKGLRGSHRHTPESLDVRPSEASRSDFEYGHRVYDDKPKRPAGEGQPSSGSSGTRSHT